MMASFWLILDKPLDKRLQQTILFNLLWATVQELRLVTHHLYLWLQVQTFLGAGFELQVRRLTLDASTRGLPELLTSLARNLEDSISLVSQSQVLWAQKIGYKIRAKKFRFCNVMILLHRFQLLVCFPHHRFKEKGPRSLQTFDRLVLHQTRDMKIMGSTPSGMSWI